MKLVELKINVTKRPLMPQKNVYYKPEEREKLARSASPAILDQLSRDHCWFVRQTVAGNPYTRPKTLLRLAYDPAEEVRMELLQNESTPREALLQLTKDDDPDVRQEAKLALIARDEAKSSENTE